MKNSTAAFIFLWPGLCAILMAFTLLTPVWRDVLLQGVGIMYMVFLPLIVLALRK